MKGNAYGIVDRDTCDQPIVSVVDHNDHQLTHCKSSVALSSEFWQNLYVKPNGIKIFLKVCGNVADDFNVIANGEDRKGKTVLVFFVPLVDDVQDLGSGSVREAMLLHPFPIIIGKGT